VLRRLLWAGIDELLIGASGDDVPTLAGFDEGPLPADWPASSRAAASAVPLQGLMRDHRARCVMREVRGRWRALSTEGQRSGTQPTGCSRNLSRGFEPEAGGRKLGERPPSRPAGHARTQRAAPGGIPRRRWRRRPAPLLPFARWVFRAAETAPAGATAIIDPKDPSAPIMTRSAAAGRHRRSRVEQSGLRRSAGKLAGLARSFGNALRPALRKRGLLTEKEDARLPRLHVCFTSGSELLLGSAAVADSSPWPMGVPRLRQSSEAPSRSALKLEEGLPHPAQRGRTRRLIQPGMRATDLGASPGGWSWVLAKRNMRVVAVDNGPMAESVLDTGLVEHMRADGFVWKPVKAQDWLVCDMVESPRKVAARMSEWFAHGWCKHAVFNLKLPMKKRWDETRDCLAAFEAQAGGRWWCARASSTMTARR
jgi:23S rRNA (cytidine2498-2'-O)-methyltransferase